MTFRDLGIKQEYRSPYDDIVSDFYIPILKYAILYKRAVGYFSSTSLIEISKGICSLVQNNGFVQIVASPYLSDEDIEAIRKGYNLRNEKIRNAIIKTLTCSNNYYEQERLNLLANLIADNKLDIKIAITEEANNFGMYIEHFKSMLCDDILFVSVMATNNEIGVNEPLAELGNLCKIHGVIFHVDASQGAYTNINVIENNIDLMSISAHKIYGPKGVGGLFVNQYLSIKPMPIIYGGGQQNGYRAGTVPVFLAVGFGEACSIIDLFNNHLSKAVIVYNTAN